MSRSEAFQSGHHDAHPDYFEDSRYFHGTNVEFDPGDVLVPGAEQEDGYGDSVDNHGLGDNKHVYMTEEPGAASLYGKNVYEVEPIGDLVDTGKKHIYGHPESAAQQARVIRSHSASPR